MAQSAINLQYPFLIEKLIQLLELPLYRRVSISSESTDFFGEMTEFE